MTSTKVTLDFESRSTVDLKKSGAWIYSLHPTTDIMCYCFMVNDESHVRRYEGPAFCEDEHYLDELEELAADKSVLFEAHYAGFEYSMWENIMHKRHGLSRIAPNRWRDSAAVAAYKAMPRALGKLCQALDTDVQKDEAGRRIMLKMCKPVPESSRHLHGFWHESEEDWETLINYCVDDVRSEHACSKILGDLPPSEQKLWLLDFKINQRGIRVDTEYIHAAKKMKEKIKKTVSIKCKEAIGYTPGQVAKIKTWLKKNGVTIPKKKVKNKVTGNLENKETLNAEAIKKMIATPEISKKVKDVLGFRQDFSTISLSKLDAALHMMDKDGIVRNQFVYHGATTGRWAGKGIQFQNLPRGLFSSDSVQLDTQLCCEAIVRDDVEYMDVWYGDLASTMGVLKSSLRGMAIPRTGYVYRVMDFSQIEARVLPWLAGQQDILEAFEAGKDLYRFTAGQVYGKTYEAIDKPERFIGKTASLALGYQGGKGAFVGMALNFGVNIDPKEAERIKNDWRRRNRRIVKFWYSMERAAIQVVRHGGRKLVHKKIAFEMNGDYLNMILPSGRRLWYYKPKVKEGKLSYMGSDSVRGIVWGRVYTYGGRLAENATQATSRCLFDGAMRNLNAEKYNIVIHVHDELVAENKPSFGSLSRMKEIMLAAPSWAKGLPIDADGFECDRYYKG